MSKFAFESRSWAIAVLAAIGFAPVLLPQASFAQESGDTIQPLDNFQDGFGNPNEVNPFTGSSDGGVDVFDILHRARFDRGRTEDEYLNNQEAILLDDAAAFRARQLELLRRQNPAPEVTEEEVAPE
ncbi:MAG: hypothetical protein D6728_08900 [Cyanobacteria bacterium J055]|nr:MAG: hypothetical protein D6728_08900 [Cyanobacteria bacterium J055]